MKHARAWAPTRAALPPTVSLRALRVSAYRAIRTVRQHLGHFAPISRHLGEHPKDRETQDQQAGGWCPNGRAQTETVRPAVDYFTSRSCHQLLVGGCSSLEWCTQGFALERVDG
jgi:hypothetical protein